MNPIKLLAFLFVTFQCYSQTKPTEYYNENEKKISEEQFKKFIDYSQNLNIYFENDTIRYGLLVTRKKYGRLDKETFVALKKYLTDLSGTAIDSSQNIVINYLTAFPKKDKKWSSRSTWNVLDKNYLKKLHNIASINQFWINSPECDNLDYHHYPKIDWLADQENLFKKLFFQYETEYGNFILIKPTGDFYYYMGEHGKNTILEVSEKFFK